MAELRQAAEAYKAAWASYADTFEGSRPRLVQRLTSAAYTFGGEGAETGRIAGEAPAGEAPRRVRIKGIHWGPGDAALQKATRACNANRWDLHRYPNVVGVAVSLKIKANKVLDIPCIVAYVQQKRPANDIRKIPSEVDGVPTDVIEAGFPVLRSQASRVRPIKPGCSISHIHSDTGTLGCFVRGKGTKEALILSNNHVIADSNMAKIGDPVVQPGTADHGNYPADAVANLTKFVRILPGINRVDAAVARPTVKFDTKIPGVGLPHGSGFVNQIGVRVLKVGRTTGATTGIIVAFNASIGPVQYPNIGNVMFKDQIVTEGMSQKGDSGSLLLTKYDKLAIGLLFSGLGDPKGGPDEVVTYYNDIRDVLSSLNVELITT